MKKKFSFLSLFLTVTMVISVCSFTVAGAKSKAATPELNVQFLTFGQSPSDLQAVNDAINKITTEKIGATIKLIPLAVSSYAQQTNLALTSGENMDLFTTGNLPPIFDYNGEVAKKQLLPLDDLLNKYGTGIKAALGTAFLNTPKIGGKIYGVATIRDLSANRGIVIRKDIAAKYKINLTKIKTVADVEKVLRTIKAKEPNMYPFSIGGGATIADNFTLPLGDNLGDRIGVLLNAQVLSVSNYFASKEYAAMCKTARSWYTSGLVSPDIVTNKESSESLIKAGKIYVYAQSLKPGIDGQLTRMAGTELVTVPVTPTITSTQNVTSFMWSIAAQSKNPEKAMQFLNLMYTDKDIVNLLDWGIEGKHYTKVAGTTNIIDYPAGVTSANTGYGLNMGFEFGNQLISDIWKGDPSDLWTKMNKFNNTAIKSKALGFSFDVSKVKTEYAAVSNVINQYKPALDSGAVDPTTKLPEFLSKLKDAGIDKIIAEKQRQLNAWAKANKK